MLLERGQRQTPTATLGLLPSGAKGTRATLRLMQRLVRVAMRDTKQFPILRRVLVQVTRRLPQKDKRGELAALFDFVQHRIRYINDPRGIETLQTPLETLQLGAGDCDDKAMLLATLAELGGYATRFVAIGRDPEHFAQEAATVAPGVLATVEGTIEELLDQVAVRRGDLDAVQTALGGKLSCARVAGDDLFDLVPARCTWLDAEARAWNSGRSKCGRTWRRRDLLAPSVEQLHEQSGARRLDRRRDPAIPRHQLGEIATQRVRGQEP